LKSKFNRKGESSFNFQSGALRDKDWPLLGEGLPEAGQNETREKSKRIKIVLKKRDM